MEKVVGFAAFVIGAAAFYVGFDWVLDQMWSSSTATGTPRPPDNAAAQWVLSGAAGLASGWVVTQVFGED